MNKSIAGVLLAVAAVGTIGVLAFAGNDAEKTNDHGDMSSNSANTNSTSKKSSGVTQETDKVTYKDIEIVQKSIKVKKGTTVTWTNEDSAKHDVTPDEETADFKASELFGKGGTHKITFNTVGTFKYHCSPHPYMKGTIEVVE